MGDRRFFYVVIGLLFFTSIGSVALADTYADLQRNAQRQRDEFERQKRIDDERERRAEMERQRRERQAEEQERRRDQQRAEQERARENQERQQRAREEQERAAVRQFQDLRENLAKQVGGEYYNPEPDRMARQFEDLRTSLKYHSTTPPKSAPVNRYVPEDDDDGSSSLPIHDNYRQTNQGTKFQSANRTPAPKREPTRTSAPAPAPRVVDPLPEFRIRQQLGMTDRPIPPQAIVYGNESADELRIKILQLDAELERKRKSEETDRLIAAVHPSYTVTSNPTSGGNSNWIYEAGNLFDNCVEYFYDPQMYNWYSIRNHCGESIKFFTSDNYSGEIRSGGKGGFGQSREEIARHPERTYAFCRPSFVPVDANGKWWRGGAYRCRKLR